MAKVSIILPTYNGYQYISSLLDSILLQTYKDIEYIIIDDKSADNTVRIIQNYMKKDSRINLYINLVHLGINKNFERGIKLAKGNYIFLCDQDDLWDRTKVEKMVNKIEHGYNLVYCDLKVIDVTGKVISKSFHRLIGTDNLYTKDITKYLLFRNLTNGCSICFKRELVNDIVPFPDDIIYDWWIMFKASLKCKIGKLDEQLVDYRIHGSNAIGFQIINRDNKLKIDNIRKHLNSLTLFSKQKNILGCRQYFNILFKFFNTRINFIKYKTNLIRYYLTSIILLWHFPRLYKYIFKNVIEDTLPKLYTILIKIWLKQKMKIY